MDSENTDMSYQIQHNKSATAKYIAFSLLYSHFISYSRSTLNDWSIVKFEEETSKMLHLEHGFVWC